MKYVMLMRNDPNAAGMMLISGQVGAASQAAGVEAYGGSVVAQLLTLGQYDVCLIADFPDPLGAAAFALSATAGGQYVETMAALDASETENMAERAVAAIGNLATSSGDDPSTPADA